MVMDDVQHSMPGIAEAAIPAVASNEGVQRQTTVVEGETVVQATSLVSGEAWSESELFALQEGQRVLGNNWRDIKRDIRFSDALYRRTIVSLKSKWARLQGKSDRSSRSKGGKPRVGEKPTQDAAECKIPVASPVVPSPGPGFSNSPVKLPVEQSKIAIVKSSASRDLQVITPEYDFREYMIENAPTLEKISNVALAPRSPKQDQISVANDRIKDIQKDIQTSPWTQNEVNALRNGVDKYGSDWKAIIEDPSFNPLLKHRTLHSVKSKWSRMLSTPKSGGVSLLTMCKGVGLKQYLNRCCFSTRSQENDIIASPWQNTKKFRSRHSFSRGKSKKDIFKFNIHWESPALEVSRQTLHTDFERPLRNDRLKVETPDVISSCEKALTSCVDGCTLEAFDILGALEIENDCLLIRISRACVACADGDFQLANSEIEQAVKELSQATDKVHVEELGNIHVIHSLILMSQGDSEACLAAIERARLCNASFDKECQAIAILAHSLTAVPSKSMEINALMWWTHQENQCSSNCEGNLQVWIVIRRLLRQLIQRHHSCLQEAWGGLKDLDFDLSVLSLPQLSPYETEDIDSLSLLPHDKKRSQREPSLSASKKLRVEEASPTVSWLN